MTKKCVRLLYHLSLVFYNDGLWTQFMNFIFSKMYPISVLLAWECFISVFKYIQWNLDTTSLDTASILLLSQFLRMPDFFPSLSLLIKPQYSVIFTTSILLQHQFFCKPKTFFSYIFQPRYNINLKNGIFTIDKRKW